MIGNHYIYRGDPKRKVFVLKRIDRWVYRFECGHWCTDSVFFDMMKCVKGQQLNIF